ncbi:MAG: hypothetical protein BA863_11075 [Desulfovibrio sp. S3730MH75]|nr:MAG: hypothetical protein BA863_11075 [Desulfovibrio sp. S3730MH75]
MKPHNYTFYLLFYILASFWSLPSAAYADTLPEFIIITEERKPYNFTKNGTIIGISADVLMLMLERTGSTQKSNDIKLYPWARGYRIIQKKTNTILFTTARTKERENLFKWVGPIGEVEYQLYALKSKNIKINSFNDLKKHNIGTIRKDVTEEFLVNKTGMSLDDFDRASSNSNNMLKLSLGRIDLVAQSYVSMINSCKESELNPDDFEPVFVLNSKGLYFAFNNETPDHIVEKLQAAFDSIKKDGKLAEIFSKYDN